MTAKRAARMTGAVGLVVLVLGAGGFGWLALSGPESRPPSTDRVSIETRRLERGRYLVHHVAVCIGCHSDHINDRFAWPIKPGTLGQGGVAFDEPMGVPGVVYAANITPDRETGLGDWTDGEIMRAIREGVDRDGQPLFPSMLYPSYRSMSDEDVRSVVAYLRTLEPIKNEVPPRRLRWLVSLLITFAPKPVEGTIETPEIDDDPIAYGEYLATLAGCAECHSPRKNGLHIEGLEYSGGWTMIGPWGTAVATNLTPHPDSYIGSATREEFIDRFKAYARIEPEHSPKVPEGLNSPMPWHAFAGMTERDLGAIYDFLHSLPPIENSVDPFPNAPENAEPPKPGPSSSSAPSADDSTPSGTMEP